MTTYSHQDRAALIIRAAKGDPDAREQLIARYDALVWAITAAYRIEGGDADLVSRDTWALIFGSLRQFRRSDQLAAWVATTTRRVCEYQLARRRAQER